MSHLCACYLTAKQTYMMLYKHGDSIVKYIASYQCRHIIASHTHTNHTN